MRLTASIVAAAAMLGLAATPAAAAVKLTCDREFTPG